MPPSGDGQRGVLVVGEAPGNQEDERGTQFIGPAGQYLRGLFRDIGIDLEEDCWRTNALICFPKDAKGRMRRPTDAEIGHCLPNLISTIKRLKPNVVMLLGGVAVKSMMSWVWRRGHDPGPVGRWVGWQIPLADPHVWVCPMWHPSYLMRQRDDEMLRFWFKRHAKAAFELTDKPPLTPDYAKHVRVEMDDERTAHVLDRMRERGGDIAFDYETDRLKPDHPDARIISCAVCWKGEKTIAFPWLSKSREAMGRLLHQPCMPKLGWNDKFEERWTVREFGRGVRGWKWDGMLGAHAIDSRPGITSLKFQSFVRMGVKPYDKSVEPFMKADGSNASNRLRDADLSDVLQYNGLDALFTYKLCEQQMKEIGDV